MEKINLQVPLNNIEDTLGTVSSPSIVLSELIKNSVDSNATNITIKIFTTNKKLLKVSDDGDGFNIDDIKKLGILSESNKKVNNNFFRKDGDFYSGSKGLGILSLFSISNEFIMETERDKERYKVYWSKGKNSFSYEKISSKNKNGTEILVPNINKEYITILTDTDELNKLKHISIKNYVNSTLNSKKILFFIDNKTCAELEVPHINSLRDKFKGSMKFIYDSKTNSLRYQYHSNNNKINQNEITIDLTQSVEISDILINNYYLNPNHIIDKGQPCKYLSFPLESFSGEILVTESRKPSKLENFGEGVRIFVNQFAMYGYLDRLNDWLTLSIFSMLKKATRYKPHNVFGYVHFENLNENESNLKISNERAYFIENGAYKKFHEIMKNIVTTLAFNIDVADKNDWFKNTIQPLVMPMSIDNCNNKKLETINIDSQNGNKDTSIQAANQKKVSSVNENIHNADLDTTKKTSDQNPTLRNTINHISNVSSGQTSIKIGKKPKFNFFNTSNIIKSPSQIKIEYNELITQLRKLEYKDFYLIYGISFRAILEDITKKYLNTRNIKLCGDFGQNIRLMTDDILATMKNTDLISTSDKSSIENILGGYNAFKNYFEVTGSEFYDKGKQGIKATKLNSFVHSPRWMEIEEAENIANNIILPLYIISKEIINKIQKKF